MRNGLQQWCAVALAAIGTMALVSLVPFLAAGRPAGAAFPLNLLYAPAWFLFDAFLWFALLIPFLCYAYVFALFSDRVTREVMAGLVAAALVLPVLSTLGHVVSGTGRALAAVMLVDAFGRVPAATLLILILILEGVGGFALLQRWRRRGQSAERADAPVWALAPPSGYDSAPAAAAPPTVLHAHVAGSNGTAPAPAAAGSNGTAPEIAPAAPPESGFEWPVEEAAAAAPDPLTEQWLLPGPAARGAMKGESAGAEAEAEAAGFMTAGDEPPPATALPPAATPPQLPPPAPQAALPPAPAPATPVPPPATAESQPAPPVPPVLPPDSPASQLASVALPPTSPAPPPATAAGQADHLAAPTVPAAPQPASPVEVTAPPAPQPAQSPASPPPPPATPAPQPTAPTAPQPAAPAPPPDAAAKPPPRGAYQVPVEILDPYEPQAAWQVDNDTREEAATLMATLAEFKIDAEVTGIRRGPVITMFELLPAPGVKISRIVNLADNIALRLAASRVRIVAPIPGKHAVGIEVPNRHRAVVSFREMVSRPQFRPDPAGMPTGVPIVLGKDITGEAQVIDLTATPHLLIAGATGAGKSVLVNALICSVLYSRTPEQVRLLLIDPKIVELKLYNDVPHLLTPVITDPKRAFQALQYCLYEMERRYALLDNLGVRDINSYNRKLAAREERVTAGPLPYLIIIIDEFADLMATTGKELEATLARLAAMARAVGIHIVLATQRPSIDVITGLIKANIPSRIAFMVASKFDSRIIIDAVGAEKLLGRGDMLFVPAWDANPLRIQGALLTEDEVELVTEKVRELGEPDYVDEDILFDDEEAELRLEPGGNDPLMDQALEVVAGAGKASASYLQRKLKIGYNRAARLVEEMEQRGIVGPANGSKPREILHLPSRE